MPDERDERIAALEREAKIECDRATHYRDVWQKAVAEVNALRAEVERLEQRDTRASVRLVEMDDEISNLTAEVERLKASLAVQSAEDADKFDRLSALEAAWLEDQREVMRVRECNEGLYVVTQKFMLALRASLEVGP